MVVVLNTLITKELKEEFFTNQIVNYIQKLRKSVGIRKTDEIEVFYSAQNKKLDEFLSRAGVTIQNSIKKGFLPISKCVGGAKCIGTDSGVVDGVKITFSIYPVSWCCYLGIGNEVFCILLFVLFIFLQVVHFTHKILQQAQHFMDMYLATRNSVTLTAEIELKTEFQVRLDGKEYTLKKGESLFASASLRASQVREK
jgi:hypothetical protein